MAVNTIHLGGEFRHFEALANAELYPGHLLEMVTTTGKVKKSTVQSGIIEAAVAVEDALQGHTVDDAYATASTVSYHIYQKGAECQVYLKALQTVVKGDKLVPAGDGTLIKSGEEDSGDTPDVFAIAMEALDLSDSDLDATLLHVRIV